MQGCGPDDASCDGVKGRFAVTYQFVDGNCPTFQAFDVNICSHGNSQNSIGGNGYFIETEVSATGCTVYVEQTRYASQLIDWRVSGDLDVIADDELHGRVLRQEFEEAMMPTGESNLVETCAGHYDVNFIKVEDNPVECASQF